MKGQKQLFSSTSDDWSTPQDFFDELDALFGFTLDPCATKKNAKCDKYFTKRDNGLIQSWAGHRVFCNPPYSNVADWVIKCHEEKDAQTVLLIPARTDTRWFHNYIYLNPQLSGSARWRHPVVFLKGRLKFSGAKSAAPFPSMLVYFYCD